mgnify:CR=1 FL=1
MNLLVKVNFNNLVDDVELIVDDNGGRIRSVSYSAMSDTLVVRISIISQFSYNSINNELLNLNHYVTNRLDEILDKPIFFHQK